MFDSFTPFECLVSSETPVTIYGVKCGTGPPLLLIHGYPQTYKIWHLVAGRLSQLYTVIAIDLRGYGRSSKPAGAADHSTYSKHVMANDCVAVMTHFGFERFFVCGHDRGARVTHKMLVDHPGKVLKAILLDIAPTAAMYGKTDFDFAKAYYHWFFLIQQYPYPEEMITANPDAFMNAHMGSKFAGLAIFDEQCMEDYRTMMRDPAAVHASCEDYRASASIDLKESEQDAAKGRRIKCPIMILWGKHGVIEKKFDPLKEWKLVSDAQVVGERVDTGHYIPEEDPQKLLEKITEFFIEASPQS